MDHQPSPSSFTTSKNNMKNMITTKHHKKSRSSLTLSYTITFACFLLIIAFQSLALNRARSPSPAMATTHHNELTFHPLKDPRVPPYALPNMTWFMSTLTGRPTPDGMPEHFVFPSPTHNQLLCIDPRRRTYALAAPAAGVPAGAAAVGGLTFVADSFYDYENPWHGLNALAGFFSWMAGNACARPARFVLFKSGATVGKLGRWVAGVLKAGLDGEEPKVESFESMHGTTSVACFEKAVVFRRGLGGMTTERRHRVFDMVRCKAWALCNAGSIDGEVERRKGLIRVTLIGREGKRAFKNESGVKAAMERECGKFRGCSLKLVHLHNMTFCEQVRLMKKTDVVATTHGAQLTNMLFMPTGSSVMEMFPAGWLAGAGVGQYIYQWFASWSQMQYEGAWRDEDGGDGGGGNLSSFLAEWTRRVVKRRLEWDTSRSNVHLPCPCRF